MFNMRIFSTLAFLGIFGLVVVFSSSTQENETPALTPDATLDQIVNALATAHTRYDTLHIVMQAQGARSVLTQEVWVSQSLDSFREQNVATSPSGDERYETSRVGNGEYIRDSVEVGGRPLVFRAGYETGEVVFALGGVSTRIAPVSIAQRLTLPDVQVQIVGVEEVNGREAIKVLSSASWRDMHIWVDLQTGIVIRDEIYSGGGTPKATTIEIVEINTPFENADQLFYVDPSAYDPEWLTDVLVPPELLGTPQPQEQ
jgi:hypothetical protein